MGAHSSAESLMAGVESDAIRVEAAALAVQMQGWLVAPCDSPEDVFEPVKPDYPGAMPYADSRLVEWCRSARDVLEAVGRG